MQQVPAQSSATVLAIVAKNSIANLLKMGALSVTVFLLPPLLVRLLDKPTYATWILILQIGTYVALIDGSIQSAISRFVARSRGLQDDRYLGQMLSSASLILLCVGLLTALLTVLGSWQLERLFPGIPLSLSADARLALFIFGFSLAISLPFSALAGAFLGLQKNHINALSGSVGKVGGAAGVAWAAYHHQHLYVMAAWMGAGNLLQTLMYLLSWRQLKIHDLLSIVHIKKAAIREFLNFCYSIFAIQVGSVLITGLDMPIVAVFDFHAAAYYAIAATVSTMLGAPHVAVVSNMIPVAAGISAAETPARLGQVVIKTTRYATGILCLLTFPLLVGMAPFLHLWVGSDYAQHTLSIAILLVIAQFIRLTLLPYAAIVFGAGQVRQMIASSVGEGVVNLAFSLVGAHYYGAMGVALGTLIGAVAGVLLHFFVSMPRTDSMTFSRAALIVSGILKPISCCLPSLVLVLLVMDHLHSLIAEIGVILIAELVSLLSLWEVNIDTRERGEITGLVLRMAHS